MKKYLIWSIFISIVLYFISSFSFPILGEKIVAPLIVIFIVAGGISVIAVIVVLIKEKF